MKEYIRELILDSQDQLITYETYMNAVLYHPIFGYYMKDNPKIGRDGDFITTSNVGDIFGKMLCKWYLSKVEAGLFSPLICEIGGGNGRFAKAFLDEWKRNTDRQLQYTIVESSPYHQGLQRERLAGYEEIKLVSSLAELNTFDGMVFSNELFDALPVRVIEKIEEVFYEVMIEIKGEELSETKVVLKDQRIIDYLHKSGLQLRDNQRIEIPLAMKEMIENISKKLAKGLVVTVDYGYTNEEWQELQHREGSLRGYFLHKMEKNPLKNPGEMDLTTHIHFDGLIKIGEQNGLQFMSLSRQDEFLLEAGILQELEENFDSNPFSEISKKNRAIRSLIMPGGMSAFFRVLVQEK